MHRTCCSDKLVVSSLQNNLLSHYWWAHRGPVPPTLSWQSTQGRTTTTTCWLHCGRPLWTRWTQRQRWSDEKQNHAVWQHQKHTQESFSDHNAGSTNRLFLADLDQVLLLLQLELLTPLLLLQQQWYSDFTVAVQTGYFWWCLLWHMASQQRPDAEEHLTAAAVGSCVKRRSSRETTSARGLPGSTLVRS